MLHVLRLVSAFLPFLGTFNSFFKYLKCLTTDNMFKFLKKHRGKIAFVGVVGAAGAGGLYLMNKYIENKMAEEQEKQKKQMLEQIRR